MTDTASEAGDVVRVTGSVAFSVTQLGRALAAFVAANPGLRVHLRVDDRSLDLCAEQLDMGVRIGPHPPDDLLSRQIAVIRRVLVAAPAYLERHGAPRAPADLKGHRCFTYSLAEAATGWDFLGPDGPEMAHVVGHFRANIGLVERDVALEGLGLALLPTCSVGPDLKAGRLVRALPGYGAGPRYAYAVFAASPVAPWSDKLADFLADRFGDTPPWGTPTSALAERMEMWHAGRGQPVCGNRAAATADGAAGR
jgi:DNA-binding transcriptional LysR family regulator